ncbi:MAG TPA: isochorismatase family cysteine hydrolase [Chloroflexota bacterium]|nr:isochorismatase family cysteine hydrolase [Chloroflexota bacterium]
MPRPARNPDLHGNVPDKSPVALLIVDMINDLEFPGGDRLAEQVMPVARRIRDLRRRAKALGIPTVFVNDNFGRWQSDFRALLEHSLHGDVPGRSMVELVVPDDEDYFVLKPKHSGFYSTTLDTLLAYLQASTLILTGIAGNSCVLFTANDAFMRDYYLIVPPDCVASIDPADNEYALRQMREVLKADTTPSTDLDLNVLRAKGRPDEGAGC